MSSRQVMQFLRRYEALPWGFAFLSPYQAVIWFLAASIAGLGVLLLLRATPAGAASSFGTRAFNFTKQGSEVDILVPSLSPAPVEGEFVVHRVVVQSDYGSAPGLVQSGLLLTSPGLGLDNCGAVSSWTKYTEYKTAGSANELSNYHCQFFGSEPSGNNDIFSVYHKTANTAEWNAMQNLAVVGTYKTNFESGYPAVGGEIASSSSLPVHSSTSAYYGNTPSWSSFNEPGRGGQFAITNPENTGIYTPHEGWTVPNPPSPFTITH
jgi:hypothetical protein